MKPKLGQVFLIDKNIITKLLSFVSIKPDDLVCEIGCGEGVLSEPLGSKAKHLVVVELDEKWLSFTKNRCKRLKNITFISQDILKTRFAMLYPKKYRVVANIPYYLSAKLCQKFVEERDCFHDITIMVQKEFAEKLVAKPGSKAYTSLGLYVSFYFDCKLLFSISKQCFRPVPKIDSAMVQLIPRNKPLVDVDEELFFKLINSAFWGRRKQLVRALKKSPFISLPKGFEQVDFFKQHPNIRGEMLSHQDFAMITSQIKEVMKQTKNNGSQ